MPWPPLSRLPMLRRLRPWWRRLRTWFARRAGLLRGRWLRLDVEVAAAGAFAWWSLPWARSRWHWALYRPAGLADSDDAPLVVLLHGCGQRAIEFAHATGLAEAAARGRFRLLCPEQREQANPWRCWNWFHPPAQGGQGELQVVLQALQAVKARVHCGAVAAVGLSAGGGLAALLAFHHADQFAAVATVAAPPLLGRGNLQDPRRVMQEGLAISPTLATLRLEHCAPLLVLHGADDDVVAPRCAAQLVEQALHVMRRQARRAGDAELSEHALDDGVEHRAGTRLMLRHRLLPALGHTWSGAIGGHPYVTTVGPPLTAFVLAFLRDVGVPLRA